MKARTKDERLRNLYSCALIVFAIVALLLVTTESRSIHSKNDKLHLQAGVRLETDGKDFYAPPALIPLLVHVVVQQEWTRRTCDESPLVLFHFFAESRQNRAPPVSSIA
jgi:hypothetical protein